MANYCENCKKLADEIERLNADVCAFEQQADEMGMEIERLKEYEDWMEEYAFKHYLKLKESEGE